MLHSQISRQAAACVEGAVAPEADPRLLDLTPDELIEAPTFAPARRAERAFSRLALLTAGALLTYMLIGISIAHHAGRL